VSGAWMRDETHRMPPLGIVCTDVEERSVSFRALG
jgi:hypothetical protein